MGQNQEREWSVKIVEAPGKPAVARFGHRKGGAAWVWDEVPYPLLGQPQTERQVLDELYGAVCEFLERNGG